ncbi:MAG: hypothetical protein ACK4NO_09135 [Glycocaulis sp.]
MIVLAASAAAASLAALSWWDTQARFYRYQLDFKFHYMLHKHAFEELGEALTVDPLIGKITFAPPNAPNKPMQIPTALMTQANLEIEGQSERYTPLLKALGFRGLVWLQPGSNEGSSALLLAPIEWNSFEVASAAIHAPGAGRPAPICPSKPYASAQSNCAFHLGGEWWHYFEWTDFSEYRKAMDECEASGENSEICRERHGHMLDAA